MMVQPTFEDGEHDLLHLGAARNEQEHLHQELPQALGSHGLLGVNLVAVENLDLLLEIKPEAREGHWLALSE